LRIDFFFIFGCQKIHYRMKKIISLVVIALVLVIAGCNKDKLYVKDLTGTWHVYKFLFKNVDETAQWLAANPYYTITFTSDGKFVEKNNATVHDTVIGGVTYADTVYASTTSGTYSFSNHYVNLILTDSTYVLMDTVLVPTLINRTYTIFDLSGSNVQLDTDTTEFYLAKNGVH
jgi:hypothetical protein